LSTLICLPYTTLFRSQIGVGTEVLGSHDVVGTAEGLAGDHGDQRNGRLGVCVQELGATADDAVPFLVGSGEWDGIIRRGTKLLRSEEHTSELQSRFDL